MQAANRRHNLRRGVRISQAVRTYTQNSGTHSALPVTLVAGGALEGNIAPFVGGFHWQSLVKAVWDQFMCMGMVIILLVWFRRRFNHQGTVAKAMSASAYTAYIIHQPVLIVLGLILMGMSLYLSLIHI